MKVGITFTEPLLGTQAGNKEIAGEFIGSKHPEGVDPDEIRASERLEEAIGKESSGFPRDENGKPMLWDYQVKGFFKDACSMQRKAMKAKDWPSDLTAHRKIIDGLIFVKPRQILLDLAGELSIIERPLRGQTPHGERIALARSEAAPAGTKIRFEVILLKKSLLKYVKIWLDYGVLRGMGQWRNSGMGRFEWREIKPAHGSSMAEQGRA